jgi:hypothetical protein
MKIFSYLISGLVLFFIYGFYIAAFDFTPIPGKLKRDNHAGFYDYRGVSNVQTELSSGSSGIDEVINEGRKTNLDFLIITDAGQNDLPKSFEGYYGNMLALVESENSYLDLRLLHYGGIKDAAPFDPKTSRLYYTDLLSQKDANDRDNIVVVAHPFKDGPTWSGAFPTGVDGLEILNPKSMSHISWVSGKTNVIWSLLCYPFNPNLAFLRLFQEPSEELSLWDKLLQNQKTFGYSGADASARAFPFASYLINFPSYQKSFEIVSNHILLESELNGNFQKDRQTILTALKRGQFYFSMDLLGDPKGFVAVLQEKDRTHMMGSTVKYNKNLRLFAKLPLEPTEFFEIVVFKNGVRVMTSNQSELNYEIGGPGAYRIEVRTIASLPLPDAKKWITWIYTNPFFIE